MTVTEAPNCSSATFTVTEAPPLPSTSAFVPAGSMPLRRTMYKKPKRSVLSPYSVPSAWRTRVLTLCSRAAASDKASQ